MGSRNSEDYQNAGFSNKTESDNESNEERYPQSPVLLDLDENSKQQQQQRQRLQLRETGDYNGVQHTAAELTEEELAIRRQNLRKRWQDAAAFERRSLQQGDQVLAIRVPEPELLGSQSSGVKAREPSQTEKGLYYALISFSLALERFQRAAAHLGVQSAARLQRDVVHVGGPQTLVALDQYPPGEQGLLVGPRSEKRGQTRAPLLGIPLERSRLRGDVDAFTGGREQLEKVGEDSLQPSRRLPPALALLRPRRRCLPLIVLLLLQQRRWTRGRFPIARPVRLGEGGDFSASEAIGQVELRHLALASSPALQQQGRLGVRVADHGHFDRRLIYVQL
ncbi:uncharacterized protein LOC103316961 isoform X2 [Nasonia vitripennis]|uniref:Uncharacterized protein n=1 Tax=Nasonia vitripennis TaxID=7425 RepID=A0A7M7QAJ2_NASVI|nr:uncharacterized protein LOC103316961 isoform X2 [Nasonia vitripennis]